MIETGDYPFGPNVTLKVTKAKGGKWPLFVRIPGWCDEAKVTVNGRDAGKAEAGTFKRIDREWEAGDEVTLLFPMEARVSHWEMDAVAVTRGPLLYSLEIPMEEQKVKKYKVPYEKEWIDNFGGDFPRKELLPKGPWNYVLSLGKDGKLDAKASVVLVPSDPFVPGKAPVTISVPAKRSDFGGWGYMREVTTGRAVDPPPSPIPDEGGEVETLKLVPFGSTQLRISLFPWFAKKGR